MSLSSLTTRSKVLTVGVLCAGAGASAGAIASASAATGSSHHAAKTAHHRRHHMRGRDLRGLARHSVQGSAVVWTKKGYKTVSFERGIVDSVNGNQLTLTEGGTKHPYKQVTVTVPSGARIRDNRTKESSLSSLTAGQRVVVVQGPNRTIVRAHTAKQGATS